MKKTGMVAILFLAVMSGSCFAGAPFINGKSSVSVNYRLSLSQAVAAGHYDRKSPGVNDNACGLSVAHDLIIDLAIRDVVVEIVNLKASVGISTEDAVKELKQMGYRPANLFELLAFGAEYPDEQRQYGIVALGSSCGTILSFPVLYGSAQERGMSLHWSGGTWSSGWRFAAVRE